MILPHQWNPPPERIAIRCPSCGDQAVFVFGRFAYVDDRPQRVVLTRHPACQTFPTTASGAKRHVVVHHPLLDPENEAGFTGKSLSEGGWERDGAHPRMREGTSLGSFACPVCLAGKAHVLTWPSDAFYVCTVRGVTLWTWTQEQCRLLRTFVAALPGERELVAGPLDLRHVPEDFLEGSAQAEVVKRLDRLLDAGDY